MMQMQRTLVTGWRGSISCLAPNHHHARGSAVLGGATLRGLRRDLYWAQGNRFGSVPMRL